MTPRILLTRETAQALLDAEENGTPPPGWALQELRLRLTDERPSGVCIACDKTLPPQTKGRRRVTCGHPECRRTYYRLYDARRYATKKGRAA